MGTAPSGARYRPRPIAAGGFEGDLHGRAEELAVLDGLLTGARAGRAATVVVHGPPGMGKSALLAATAGRAEEQGFRVLATAGLEWERDLPFASLDALLRPVLGEVPLSPALGEALGGALGTRDAPAPPLATCRAVLALVSGLAAHEPLLVILDDLHWVDPASRRALLFVAHRLDADRVLVALAQRDGGSGLSEDAPFTWLSLGGLGRDEVVALLAGHGVAEPVAERCHELTGGHPLALVEGLAGLDADQRAGRAPLPAVWPLGERLGGRMFVVLGGLPERSRLALAIAALEPTGDRTVIDDALARLGGDPSAFAPAEQAGLVHSDSGGVTWRHPLVAAAAVHHHPRPLRREIHRALADAGPGRLHPDRIAWHLARSAAGPDESLAERLEAIGRRRVQQGAPSAAADALERAAEVSADHAGARRRRLAAAECLLSAMRMEEAVAHLAPIIETVEDPVDAADLALVLGQAELWTVGARPAARRLESHAVRVEEVAPARAGLLMAYAAVAHLLDLAPDAAHEASQRSLAMMQRVEEQGTADAVFSFGARALEGVTAVLAGVRRSRSGELAQAAETTLLVQAAGSPDASTLLHIIAQAMVAQDEHGAVLGIAGRALELAQSDGVPGREMTIRLLRADCLWRAGRWTESLAEVEHVASVDRAVGTTTSAVLARGMLARVEAGLGLVERCRRHAEEAIAASRRHGLPTVEAQARAALGLAALGEGDHDRAAAELERLAGQLAGVRQPGWLWWRADAIEALHGAGRAGAARVHLDLLADEAAATGNRWAAAAVERCRALLGLVEPVAACTRAIEGFRALDAAFEEARTLLVRGEARRREGDADALDDLLAAARRFDHLGAPRWRDRAGRAVEGFESGPSLSARLTSAELRVALAVGRGATNRQAADELYLSVKTVDFHLQSIYKKLGLRRRTQLVALVATGPP